MGLKIISIARQRTVQTKSATIKSEMKPYRSGMRKLALFNEFSKYPLVKHASTRAGAHRRRNSSSGMPSEVRRESITRSIAFCCGVSTSLSRMSVGEAFSQKESQAARSAGFQLRHIPSYEWAAGPRPT